MLCLKCLMAGIIQRAHVIFGGASLCRECIGKANTTWRRNPGSSPGSSGKQVLDPSSLYFEVGAEPVPKTNKELEELAA